MPAKSDQKLERKVKSSFPPGNGENGGETATHGTYIGPKIAIIPGFSSEQIIRLTSLVMSLISVGLDGRFESFETRFIIPHALFFFFQKIKEKIRLSRKTERGKKMIHTASLRIKFTSKIWTIMINFAIALKKYMIHTTSLRIKLASKMKTILINFSIPLKKSMIYTTSLKIKPTLVNFSIALKNKT